MFQHSPVTQIFISLIVVVANIIILIKIRNVRRMHHVMKYLIIHLAVADLLFGFTYCMRTIILSFSPSATTACVLLLAPAITFGGTSLTAMLIFYGHTIHCVIRLHPTTKQGSTVTKIVIVALACWIPWLVVGSSAFVLFKQSGSRSSSVTTLSSSAFELLTDIKESNSSLTSSLCRITSKAHNQDFILFVSVVFLFHVILVLVFQLFCIAALRRRLVDARKMAAAAMLSLTSKRSTNTIVDEGGVTMLVPCTTISRPDCPKVLIPSTSIPRPDSQKVLIEEEAVAEFVDDRTAKNTTTKVITIKTRRQPKVGRKSTIVVTPAVRYLRNSTAAFRLIVMVTIIFSLCWLPYIICLLLHVVCPHGCGVTAEITFTLCSLTVAKGALNVFVYSVGCREFRVSCISPTKLFRSLSNLQRSSVRN